MIHITELKPEHHIAAAELFAAGYQRLRRDAPALPGRLEQVDEICAGLEKRPGLAAWQDGRLAGYLSWFVVPHFRHTAHRAAYCPEWGHATIEEGRPSIYRALYREAAARWQAAGCQTHAITLLANDTAARETWFWNGFGLAVVDAVRPLTPIPGQPDTGLEIRQAGLGDVDILEKLEAEHWLHYHQPPVLMETPQPSDAAEFTRLLAEPKNSAWLALDGGEPAGYLRLEGVSAGSAGIVQSETTAAITGAYVRPAYRGRQAAVALVNAALAHYAGLGYERCSVDFESFNPEAAVFWPRYFQPVCYSLLRVPEKQPLPG